MAVTHEELFLARLTTTEVADVLRSEHPLVVLVPVGAVEPHGPHLPLDTDVLISRGTALRAAHELRARGILAFLAPDVSYGVTECARAFAGAASVPAQAVSGYLAGVVGGLLANDGVAHVCLVNSHLEPAHDRAIRAAVEAFEGRRASVASPLTRRWARTLSQEFRRGACHAGEYETSIVLALSPDSVRETERSALPDVDVSLSDKLREGVTDFAKMGLSRAYAGSPARATIAHGEDMLSRLAEMVVAEVTEAMCPGG